MAPNVWMGVTIENRRFVHRADSLREVPAAVRFISAEPLLGPLEGLDLDGIDWLIAGGESGPRHRRIDPAWATELRDRCLHEGVAFFFKQWGGHARRAVGGNSLASNGTTCPSQSGAVPLSLSREAHRRARRVVALSAPRRLDYLDLAGLLK